MVRLELCIKMNRSNELLIEMENKNKDSYVPKKKALRQILWYFCLVSVTIVFILLYSSSLNSVLPSFPQMKWPKFTSRTAVPKDLTTTVSIGTVTKQSSQLRVHSKELLTDSLEDTENNISDSIETVHLNDTVEHELFKLTMKPSAASHDYLPDEISETEISEEILGTVLPDEVSETDRSDKNNQLDVVLEADQSDEIPTLNHFDEIPTFNHFDEIPTLNHFDEIPTLNHLDEISETDEPNAETETDELNAETETDGQSVEIEINQSNEFPETLRPDEFTELDETVEENAGPEIDQWNTSTESDPSDEIFKTYLPDKNLGTYPPNEQNLSEEISETEATKQDQSSETSKLTQDVELYKQHDIKTVQSTDFPKVKKQFEFSKSVYTTTNSVNLSKLKTSVNVTETTMKSSYAVYSDECQIPDLDPFHPSIRHLIEIMEPLNCSEYSPLSSTKANTLIINKKIAESRGILNYTCCYNVIYRNLDGQTDNSYRYSNKCFKLTKEKTNIEEEFIRVECRSNESIFYREYHSFIQDKPKVEERCRNSTAKYNILIVGIDSVSRLNMHRQLNKTAQFLIEELGALEMFGFNKVGDNTFPNLVPLLLGYDSKELPKVCWKKRHFDECNFIWNRFNEKGYRTLYAEDTPYISSFNYLKLGFKHQPTDYYIRNFMQAYENELGRDKPYNCHLCVGSVSETEAILQWVGKFAIHFKDRPYFAFAWINSLTHDSLNMGSLGDHMYKALFQELNSSGALTNTIVVLMGDHGMRWGDIRSTYIGLLEERLPMLVVMLPKSFQEERPQMTAILKENQHRLVTPYDLYATLNHVLNLNGEWHDANLEGSIVKELRETVFNRSLSLFTPIPERRSCKDAYIDEHWCTCETSFPTSLSNKNVKFIALFLVNRINLKLKKKRKVCAHLKLSKIMQARLLHHKQDKVGNTTNIYTITFETIPGHGVFEGTTRLLDTHSEPELIGTISRLNMYGNQSSCIHSVALVKFCYCTKIV